MFKNRKLEAVKKKMDRSVRPRPTMDLPRDLFPTIFSYMDPADTLGFRTANRENRAMCARSQWRQHNPVRDYEKWHRSFPHATFDTLELDKHPCVGFTLLNPECVQTLRGVRKLVLHDADAFFIPREVASVIQGVETLNLGCYVMRFEDLNVLCGPRLKHLSLYDCAVFDEWFRYFHRLETLVVNEASLITDAALAHLHRVQTLVLHGATQLTDAGLAHLSRVRTLVLHGATHISNAGLALLNVETLALSYSPFISDEGMAGLRNVRSLGVTGCPYVTERAYQSLWLRPLWYSVRVRGRKGVGFISDADSWLNIPHGWHFALLNLVEL
jgi:hypothetical protein